MTLIHELDPYSLEMYTGWAKVNFLCQGFRMLSPDRQTERRPRNYIQRRFASSQKCWLIFLWHGVVLKLKGRAACHVDNRICLSCFILHYVDVALETPGSSIVSRCFVKASNIGQLHGIPRYNMASSFYMICRLNDLVLYLYSLRFICPVSGGAEPVKDAPNLTVWVVGPLATARSGPIDGDGVGGRPVQVVHRCLAVYWSPTTTARKHQWTRPGGTPRGNSF